LGVNPTDRIRYLLDENVPLAVADALRRRKIEVLTAGDAGLRGAPDTEYLELSFTGGRVLVTHDSDFVRMHRAGQPHAGIVYGEQGTRTIGQIVSVLITIHDILEPREMVGRLEFL